MTHRHEWTMQDTIDYAVVCKHCFEGLSWTKTERRLNATECLTAGQADTAASLIRGHTVKDNLKDYCKTLRGEQ